MRERLCTPDEEELELRAESVQAQSVIDIWRKEGVWPLKLKECEMYGVRLGEQTLKCYAAEMKAQEAFAKKEWKMEG